MGVSNSPHCDNLNKVMTTQVKQWDRLNHVDLYLDGDYNFLFNGRKELTIQDAINFNEIEEEEMQANEWNDTLASFNHITA